MRFEDEVVRLELQESRKKEQLYSPRPMRVTHIAIAVGLVRVSTHCHPLTVGHSTIVRLVKRWWPVPAEAVCESRIRFTADAATIL